MGKRQRKRRRQNPPTPFVEMGDEPITAADPLEAGLGVVNVSMIVGGDSGELTGMLMHGNEIVGTIPGTSAERIGLEKCAEISGYPVNYHKVQRIAHNAGMYAAETYPVPTADSQRRRVE